MLPRLMKAWLPAVVVCFLIFVLSQDSHSGQHSNAVLGWLLTVVGLNTHHYHVLLNEPFRKFCHFVVYFSLGATVYRGFALGHPTFDFGAAVRSFVFSAAYACTDEFHQSLIPGRGGDSPRDVFLDTGSAIFALLVIWLFFRWRSPSLPAPASSAPTPSGSLSTQPD